MRPFPSERQMRALFRAKEARRRRLAALPIEEKIRILIRLQKRADEVSRNSRGVGRRVWKIR